MSGVEDLKTRKERFDTDADTGLASEYVAAFFETWQRYLLRASRLCGLLSGQHYPMQGQLVTSLMVLDGPQDAPGDRTAELAMQGLGSDRRASSTVAVCDEVPMNSQEAHEDGF